MKTSRKTQPSIRDTKSYKAAVARATKWQTLFENEENRIMEYFAFRRTLQSKQQQLRTTH